MENTKPRKQKFNILVDIAIEFMRKKLTSDEFFVDAGVKAKRVGKCLRIDYSADESDACWIGDVIDHTVKKVFDIKKTHKVVHVSCIGNSIWVRFKKAKK